jgi:hypothetical protein
MKFCGKCGTQLEDDSQFCYKCGSGTEDVQSFTPAADTPPVSVDAPVMAGRKRSKALFIILPIVLVLLLGGGAAYYFLGVQTPAVQFVKANEMFFASAIDNAAKTDDLAARMEKENYEVTGEIKLNEITGIDDATKQMLTGFSIMYGGIKDTDDYAAKLAVNMGGTEFLALSGLLAEDKIYAGISQAGKIASASYMDVPGDKDKPVMERLKELLPTKTDNDTKKLLEKIKNLAVQCIDMQWFSVGQGTYEDLSGGGDVSATAISLKMDTKALKTFFDKFYEKAESDPTFFDDLGDFIKSKMKDSGAKVPDDFDAQMKKAFKEAGTSIPEGTAVAWTAYQKDGKTGALQFTMTVGGENKDAIELLLQSGKQDKTNALALRMKYTSAVSSPFNLLFTFKDTKKDDGNTFDIALSFDGDGQKGGVTIAGDNKITKKSTSEYTGNTTINILADIPGLETKPTISLGIENQYVFGKADLSGKLTELRQKATKVKDLQELFTTLFSGALGGSVDFSGLLGGSTVPQT